MTTSYLHPLRLAWLLLCIGVFNTVAWLDSLDRYLDARYHFALEDWVAEPLYAPSRQLNAWLAAASPVAGAAATLPGGHSTGVNVGAGAAGLAAAQKAASAGEAAHAASQAAWAAARNAANAVADAALRHTPSAVVLASTADAASDKPRYSVQPLAAGKFWPSQHRQSLRAGPQYILFAGDSMMQGVAPLLMRELSQQHPDWQTLDDSRQSTGLTVKRYFDWPARINERIDTLPLTLVVVFLGPNDPWDIYEPGRHLVFPSPQWEAHYASRVDAILSYAVAHGVRVLWIGLPSMRDGRVHDGAVLQNQIFAQRALAYGTDYLATEGLIGPLSLPFQRYLGTDTAQSLRAADGIHFTPAGLHRIKQAVLEHLAASTAQP